ncbi:MAB_1171c family putative transporter [Streptantibioticus ferralitis]|uniref:DUF6545 domain-containing protein n=1 Tax=Streptantibioticus ferralitis TaxID=236510 RepID=A0ABT5YX28_9ACTN|nr:MAB_1171c family putative transporter [Streptantibioticus ferralitis]MDF2256109.1 hypothetical protein [Streptantibioticus ferralitis]
MVYQILSWTCAVAGLSAFLYKLPALWHSNRNPAMLALCVYFLSSGLSFLVDLDAIRASISRLLDYPNITTILVQAAVVALTAAQQVVLIHWSHPAAEARRRTRRRLLGFGIALVVLVTMFYVVDPTRHPTTAETSVLLNMQNPYYAAYLCYYIGVCTVGQIAAFRLSLRYARIANRLWLRLGMWSVTTGATFVLLYCTIRYAEIAATRLGFDTTPWDSLYWFTGDIGSLLQLFGWTVPSWGPRLSAAARWLESYRSYRRLRPLWWALYRAVPAIALDPPPSPLLDLLPPRDLEYRLYRRVIEIRDGQLALRPYLCHALAGPQAEQLGPAHDEPSSATHEALRLKAALRARSDNAVPPTGPTTAFPGARNEDFGKEIAWLTRVADSFRRPPHR